MLTRRAPSVAAGIEHDPDYRRALHLAELVQAVARQGEREWQACEAILRGLADYLRSRPHSGSAL